MQKRNQYSKVSAAYLLHIQIKFVCVAGAQNLLFIDIARHFSSSGLSYIMRHENYAKGLILKGTIQVGDYATNQ